VGRFINLLDDLPKAKRPLEQRSIISEEDKYHHWMLSQNYFDGTRDQGYGGYSNDGRWNPVAARLESFYSLDNSSALLDIGCAKGFLLNSFKEQSSKYDLWGLDISEYALSNAVFQDQINYILGNAKDLPFEDNSFDFVLSINSLHNILNINDFIKALKEIERVSSKHSYITNAAYKTDAEKKIIDEWAVVATTYMHEDEWLELFDKAGYSGDYYWFKPHLSFGVK